MNINPPFISSNQSDLFKENSEALTNILASEEIDFDHLLTIISERERLIKEHLDSLSDEEKKQFVADELKTNEDLKKIVGALKAEQQALLVNFLRSKKAIKKYNK